LGSPLKSVDLVTVEHIKDPTWQRWKSRSWKLPFALLFAPLQEATDATDVGVNARFGKGPAALAAIFE
jgi:hypothetical protein